MSYGDIQILGKINPSMLINRITCKYTLKHFSHIHIQSTDHYSLVSFFHHINFLIV